MERIATIEESDVINSICFLKDKRLVLILDERIIVVYNKEYSERDITIQQDFRVFTICGLKQRNLLAYAGGSIDGYNHYISISEIEGKDYRLIHRLGDHKSYINKVIELQDGRLCSCSDDQTIRIWDNHNKYQCTHILKEVFKNFRNIIEINEYILSFDVFLRVWSKSTYKCLQTFEDSSFTEVLSKIDDNKIIIGGDCKLSIFDALSFKVKSFKNNQIGDVKSICALENDRILLGNNQGFLCLLSLPSNKVIFISKFHYGRINTIIKNEDNKIFASSLDNTISTYILQNYFATFQLLTTITLGGNKVYCLCLLKDGRLALHFWNGILICRKHSYEVDIFIEDVCEKASEMIALRNGNLACYTLEEIKIWEIKGNNFNLIYTFKESNDDTTTILRVTELEDGRISVFTRINNYYVVKILNKNYEVIEVLERDTCPLMEINNYFLCFSYESNDDLIHPFFTFREIWDKSTYQLIKELPEIYNIKTVSKLDDNKVIFVRKDSYSILDTSSFQINSFSFINRNNFGYGFYYHKLSFTLLKSDLLVMINNNGYIVFSDLSLNKIIFNQQLSRYDTKIEHIVKNEDNKIFIPIDDEIRIYEWMDK